MKYYILWAGIFLRFLSFLILVSEEKRRSDVRRIGMVNRDLFLGWAEGSSSSTKHVRQPPEAQRVLEQLFKLASEH
ncbi:MAG: hypothetical protein ACUVQY_04450 [Thermoproteota archaeon]